MDDELRDAERRARERGDAASFLAWAAALRRLGRDMEAAAAAFEARARGASRDEVFPLAQPREGGGDALAPWPHPRGDSAGTRRSRVEGPDARARVLFEIDLGEEDIGSGHGPVVLPDGSVAVSLDRAAHGGSYVRCFTRDGAPRWSVGLRENVSAPVALATGELAIATPRELITLAATDGRELSRVPLVPSAARGEVVTWRTPAAWNRSVVVGDKVVGSGGDVRELRGREGKRLIARSPAVGPGGTCYLPAYAYSFEPPSRPGAAPPLVRDPPAVHAFGLEGEYRWSYPVDVETSQHAACRDRLLVLARTDLMAVDRATGTLLERRPFGGAYLALDPSDEPVPTAPFGPPLLGPPAVDAAGRRYALNARGDLVGLGPESRPLFVVTLGFAKHSLVNTLALGKGRLHFLKLSAERRSIVVVGEE